MTIVQASKSDSLILSQIIKNSNAAVAQQFHINKDNNPKHPSFYTEQWACSDFERGEIYFMYQDGDLPLGCVAFERANDSVAYLNRLSVLPDYQRQGIGEVLVKHVLHYATSQGISKISIGIIAEHTVLKNWYLKLGFKESGIKKFDHLPFDVMFMIYTL